VKKSELRRLIREEIQEALGNNRGSNISPQAVGLKNGNNLEFADGSKVINIQRKYPRSTIFTAILKKKGNAYFNKSKVGDEVNFSTTTVIIKKKF